MIVKQFSVVSLVLLLICTDVLAEARVELELATEPGFPPTSSRDWIEALKGAGFAGIRIRAARAGDVVQVSNIGTPEAPAYRVVGALTADGLLKLPGGTFRVTDRGGIRSWRQKTAAGGEAGIAGGNDGAFGLTPRQLVFVHESVKGPVVFSTAGQPAVDLLKKLVNVVRVDIQVDASARPALASQYKFADELQGLSGGTSMAAVLRTLGLVMVPRDAGGGDVELFVADAANAKEFWPIGWPSKQPPREVMPNLFKFLTVEVDNTPLAETLPALSGRLEAPILVDHNALARMGTDVHDLKVSFPERRTYYKSLLDQLLIPKQLRNDIRLDEADKPFLWVTSTRTF